MTANGEAWDQLLIRRCGSFQKCPEFLKRKRCADNWAAFASERKLQHMRSRPVDDPPMSHPVLSVASHQRILTSTDGIHRVRRGSARDAGNAILIGSQDILGRHKCQ